MNKIVLIVFLFLPILSCSRVHPQADKPVISVSILPQKYFLEKLSAGHVEINVMIPPGASPATYEPTPSQLTRLSQSTLYMRIGYVGFENSWMDKLMAINPRMKITDLSKGIEVIREEEKTPHHGHDHIGIDPHVWMSVPNARVIAVNVYNELLLLLPGEQALLKERFESFSSELDSLHLAISSLLNDKENGSFMIYHPALTYFARDYNLIQMSLEIEGKTPSPAHLKRMTDLGLENNIKTIFIQSQFDRTNAEILAKETGAGIIQFNPLDEEWKSQMLYIAEQLHSTL